MTFFLHRPSWTQRQSRRIPHIVLVCLIAGSSVSCTFNDRQHGADTTLQPTGVYPSQSSDTSVATSSAPPTLSGIFAPPPRPDAYDAKRAVMPLSAIPNDPPAPTVSDAVTPELPRQALKRLEDARQLLADQRYAEAAVEAKKVLRYHDQVIEAHRIAALALLASDRDKEAVEHANTAISLQPDDLACHYVKARAADKGDQFETALAEYRTVLKCPVPRDGINSVDYLTLTNYHLGMMLQDMGFYQAAIEPFNRFETAVRSLGNRPSSNPELAIIVRTQRSEMLETLAESHEVLKDYTQAANVLAKAIQLSSHDGDLRERYIKNLVRAKRLDEACQQANQWASDNEGELDSAQLLVEVYRVAGRADRGLAALKKIVADHPDQMQTALFYAEQLKSNKQYSAAADVLNDVITRFPKEADSARWDLIAIYRLQNNYHDWLHVVASQLASDPSNPTPARNELAELPEADAKRLLNDKLKQLGDELKQSTNAAATATAQPTTQPTLDNLSAARDYCLAILADRLDRVDDAQTLFERALKTNAHFDPAMTGIAQLWMRRYQWDRAIETLRAVVIDEGDHRRVAMVNRLMGQCYESLDEHSDAIKCYQKAIESNEDGTNDRDTYLSLANVYRRARRLSEAYQVYAELIKKHPDFLEANEQLIVFLLTYWNADNVMQQVAEPLNTLKKKGPGKPITVRTAVFIRMVIQPPTTAAEIAECIRPLQNLVTANPNDVDSQKMLAVVYHRARNYEAAEQHARKVLALDPNNSDAAGVLGIALMKRLDIDSLASLLTEWLKKFPNREALLTGLTDVRLIQQDYAGATAALEKLLSFKAYSDRRQAFRARLVLTWLQAGWYDKIRETAEKWIEKADESELLTLRGYLLTADAAQGRYDDYLNRCHEWLDEKKEDTNLRGLLLGIVPLFGHLKGGLIGADREEEAVIQAATWLMQAPSESWPQILLWQTLKEAGHSAEAIEIWRANLSTAEKGPDKFNALRYLSEAYLDAKQYDQAIATIKELGAMAAEKAGQIENVDANLLTTLQTVRILTKAERYDDAIAQCNQLLSELSTQDERFKQLSDNNKLDSTQKQKIKQVREAFRGQRIQTLQSLAFVYDKQKRVTQAIETLRQALALSPNNSMAQNSLGYMLADSGTHLDEAEQLLQSAVGDVLWNGIGVDERQSAYTDSLGWLYYKQGRFQEAVQWLKLSMKLDNQQSATIHDHLADALWRVALYETAKQQWELALEVQKKQARRGQSDEDDHWVDAVKTKLDEASKLGGKPAVATAPAVDH